MVNDEIVEPSISSYNSPILLVPKKSDNAERKWRLVVDYRQLNKKILGDKFPLPRIDSILDELGRAKFFSTLDLMSGFHQIPLDKESRKLTAFSTQKGHYQFTRMPFGLNISPNSFQRMMAIAMAGLTPEHAFIYIDDIVVIGCSVKHHLSNLIKVFDRLRQYNLKLNMNKCKFFKSEVVYLGHQITDRGILPDDKKFDTIKNYPVPKNADEVRRFVAFCNYYRKFVSNFATIAYPLNQLLRKKVVFIWNNNCQKAFDTLRSSLMSPKILQYPDFQKEFILTTDASDIGCGAILSQNYGSDDLPIAFASKIFTQGEKNKPVILKELTAIHWAVDYFKAYLYGRKFVIRTDHKPLVFLFGMKNPTSKLTRMRLDLEEFDFTIEYIKGKDNVGADALSRITTTSDTLKSMTMLVVNTRSMTRDMANAAKPKQQQTVDINKKPDQLQVYTTENPSTTTKLTKLHTKIEKNTLILTMVKKSNKNIIAQVQEKILNGSQTLEIALPRIEKFAKDLKINELALSIEEDVFTLWPINILKAIANRTLKTLQVIIYQPPKFLTNSVEIQTVLNNYHNSKIGGHIGQHRLYLKLRELYKFKDMKGTIAQWIKSCELCKKNKTTKHTKENQVVTTTPSSPFEIISIDTVGPLPRSSNHNRYAITLQCDLTKYIVLMPIPDKEATTIAKALVKEFILIYGNFLELKSDQGTEYKNEVLHQICKLLEIKQTFATAYHPQTIGSLERNHRCLNEYLRSFTNEQQSDWDENLQYYAFIYNTTPHVTHGFTPYELVFGKKANIPQEVVNKGIEPAYNLDNYANEVKFKIQKFNQIAKEKLIESKISRTNKLNTKLNPIDIHINDLVYLTNENRKKLDPLYNGPFEVIDILEPNCIIKNSQTQNIVKVHKNRLVKA